MQDMVTLKIDGKAITVPRGTTVLEAAKKVGIKIPSLCYLKESNAIGACRMCIVDIGTRSLPASCTLPVEEGMEVKTNTPEVRKARRTNMELILSNHDRNCLTCIRNQSCELQKLAEELGVRDIKYAGEIEDYKLDLSSTSIIRDPKKCILCRRCIAACSNVQHVNVIGATHRGFKTMVETAFGKPIAEVGCINCGQCIAACPVGALSEVDDTHRVWKALEDPKKHVVVQTAPAVRVALGEEFGMPIGTRVTGKLAAALRQLGFNKVFDTDFAADLTIMEEGTELINRLQEGGKLPLISSCSPGWVKYMEHYYPEFIDNMSSCKSPQQMMGAVIKSYYAKLNSIDPKDIYSVSVMPCTAKKYERQREEMAGDVDVVITTRELARMIKEAGIDFANLPDEDYDDVLGKSTGAAAIFGVTGGVMEAALRTVAEILTGKPLENIEFTQVRGIAGVKEATIKIGDLDVNVAVAHGTGNAKELLKLVKDGNKQYHFIEIMACPGGCINGGGQPHVHSQVKMELNPIELRAKALYDEDESMVIRKSHENPEIKRIYKEFLGEPGGHKAHELLHTHYSKRERY